MSIQTLLPYAVFGAITLGGWGLIDFLSKRRSRAEERLDELRDPRRRSRDAVDEKSSMAGLFEKAAPGLAKALQPKTELEQNKLKIRLANAGYNNPGAPQLFLALKTSLLVVGGLIGSAYGLLAYGLELKGVAAFVVGGGIGFYLPELLLKLKIWKRQEQVFLGLPDALDLLVVCVEAGLGLDAGMRRVAEELGDTHTAVCGELNLANMQLQMGRQRRDVLHDLGVRTGVDDMKALAAILIQADKFGSSIAQALRVQSDGMRIKRRQIAEEKAQQTAVKMIFPLVLFIFPGIFVVLVGPAAIMLKEGLLSS
ncbi:MAG: type II secretion system F family protein [Planctomycetaceae bacterium]